MKTKPLLVGCYVYTDVGLCVQNPTPQDNGYSLPNRYLVKLNRWCDLEQHLRNIQAWRSDKVFSHTVDLTSFNDIYVGSFQAAERARIASDHDCVRDIIGDQRAQTVRRRFEGASSEPGGTPINTEASDNGAYYDRSWGSPNSVAVGPSNTEERTWQLSTEPKAPWHLLMMAVNEKRPIKTASGKLFGLKEAEQAYDYVSEPGKGVDIYHFGFFSPATKIAEFRQKSGFFRFARGESRASEFKRYEADTTSQWDDIKRGVSEASLAAGLKYGIAKSANIFGVEVSSAGGILEAFRDILQEHRRKLKPRSEYRGAVISFNLAVSKPKLLYEIEYAIRKLDEAGILIVAPAGDQGRSVGASVVSQEDKSGTSTTLTRRGEFPHDIQRSLDYPCKFGRVLCVGATDRIYSKASFSGHGRAVHMYAPGVDVSIVPPYNKDPAITNGTNLASALVTGFAATILSYEFQRRQSLARDTYGLRRLLLGNCKRNYLEGLETGSRNLLANTGIKSATINRPYTHGAIWAAIKDEDFEVSLGRNDQLHAYEQFPNLPRIFCFATHSPKRITWFEAEKLYLRLEWERGHSNSFDSEDHWSYPIYCVDTACVYLRYVGESTLQILDASILADCLLRILSHCKGNQPEGGSTLTTGGRLEVTEYSRGAPTKMILELGKEITP